MPKLGADFNAGDPTDAAFVRHPTKPNLATEIRTIRSRLKDFFGGLFDLESGDFKDNVVPPAAWVDSPTNPSSGTDLYTQVTVDRRGFVVRGSMEQVLNSPRVFRAVYTSSGGFFERPDGLTSLPASPVQWWDTRVLWSKTPNGIQTYLPNVREYKFIVPDKVTRMNVLVIGNGFDVYTARAAWTSFAVAPNDIYRVWVGCTNASPSAFLSPDYQRYVTSEGYAYDVNKMGVGTVAIRNLYIANPGNPYTVSDTVLVLRNLPTEFTLADVPPGAIIHTLGGEILRVLASRDIAAGTEITVQRGFWGSTPSAVGLADGDVLKGDGARPALNTFENPPFQPYGMAGNSVGFNFNGVGQPGAVIVEWYA